MKYIYKTIVAGDKKTASMMLLSGKATVIQVGTKVSVLKKDWWNKMVNIKIIGDTSGETWWANQKAVFGE